MKPCTICGEEKPLSEFSKKKGNKDGHDNRCKACFAEYNSLRWHNDRKIEPCQERAYKPRLSGRPWEVTRSIMDKYDNPTWIIGSRLTTIDVSCTLKLGNFDNGMRLRNRSTDSSYTVAMVDDCQVLRNKRYCLFPTHGGGLRRVKASEIA